MEIKEIKKELLADSEFKEEIAKYISERNYKWLDEIIKIDGEKVGKLIAPSVGNEFSNKL